MRKHPSRMIIATVAVTCGLLLITLLSGSRPNLGLDLQGGVAVNLQPVEDGEVTADVTEDQLDQAIEIIRRRVDALGVAEPEVSRQGNTISVQLPGAKDQGEVLEAVGKTARLEFRPLLAAVGEVLDEEGRAEAQVRIGELRESLGLPEGVTAQQVYEDEVAKATTAQAETETEAGTEEGAEDDGAAAGESTTTTSTTVPEGPLNQWGIDISSEEFSELAGLEMQVEAEVTPPAERTDEAEVTLTMDDGTAYRLGPLALDGRTVETATSGLTGQGQWTVSPVFRGGADGIDQFNEIAAVCYSGGATCPDLGGGNGQLAIVLDGEILSAPTIQQPTFDREGIQISGSFDRESAESLAVALRFGSLPIELEPQQAETVSATLGKGALRAGIISGLVGLALATLYMLLYYRLLAVVAIGGLAISGASLWVIMSLVGATVTLAGVVGIVVSVGVTVDSTVVYFESLKEYVRGGASVRAAVDRSFGTAYSTIVKANVASLIGAGILYWLAVGPVRGFAFYLGAMTLLNLLATYVFVYPATAVIARSRLGDHPSRLGIPIDDLVEAGTGPHHDPPKPTADASATIPGVS